MRTITLIFLLLALPTSLLAQEGVKYGDDVSFYTVVFTKFKPGKADAATEMIYKYFVPADGDIGRKVINFDFSTGEWDHVVFFPMKDGVSEFEWKTPPTEGAWMAAFTKRVGGQEKAAEMMAQWDGLVAEQRTELVRYTKKPWE